MKKTLWTIGFFFMAVLAQVNGQVIKSQGVKGGFTLSNMSYQFTPINYTLVTDLAAGPNLVYFMEAFAGEHFGLQTDVGFACRASSTTTQSVTVNHLDNNRVVANPGDPATSRFRYLYVAPMLRARSPRGRFTPYALAGPRLNVLVRYTTEWDYPLEEQNKLIVGLSLGVGVEYEVNNKAILLEIQYQPDLSPVTNQDPLLVNLNSLFFTVGIRWQRSE